MKKVLVLLLTLLPLTGMAQGIVFEKGTIAEAIAKAKAENKLLFVDVYTDWCGPCKVMSAGTFMDEQVGNLFNKNFINIKVDAEKGDGIEFAKKYSVSAYPTMLFLNANGDVVHRILGARNAEKLLGEAGIMSKAARFGGIEAMVEKFAAGEQDPEFLLEFYNTFPESDTKNRGEIAMRYLTTAPDEILFNVTDEETIHMLGDMIYVMPRFDRPLGDRLIYGWRGLYGRLDAPETVTEQYYMGVMASYKFRLSKLIQQAIDSGDREAMKAMIEFIETVPKDKSGSEGIGHMYDVFNRTTSGRGLFFVDAEYQWLEFMTANMEDPAVFKPYLESYMDKVMTEFPVDSLNRWHYARLEHYEKLGRSIWQFSSYSERGVSDISIDAVIKWATYYWYVSPSNKATKDTIAKWINWTMRLNRLYTPGVINSTPLMLKIGKKKEAVENLKLIIDGFSSLDEFYPDEAAALRLLLHRVETDKAF